MVLWQDRDQGLAREFWQGEEEKRENG